MGHAGYGKPRLQTPQPNSPPVSPGGFARTVVEVNVEMGEQEEVVIFDAVQKSERRASAEGSSTLRC
jgi:hypothetical protein